MTFVSGKWNGFLEMGRQDCMQILLYLLQLTRLLLQASLTTPLACYPSITASFLDTPTTTNNNNSTANKLHLYLSTSLVRTTPSQLLCSATLMLPQGALLSPSTLVAIRCLAVHCYRNVVSLGLVLAHVYWRFLFTSNTAKFDIYTYLGFFFFFFR